MSECSAHYNQVAGDHISRSANTCLERSTQLPLGTQVRHNMHAPALQESYTQFSGSHRRHGLEHCTGHTPCPRRCDIIYRRSTLHAFQGHSNLTQQVKIFIFKLKCFREVLSIPGTSPEVVQWECEPGALQDLKNTAKRLAAARRAHDTKIKSNNRPGTLSAL